MKRTNSVQLCKRDPEASWEKIKDIAKSETKKGIAKTETKTEKKSQNPKTKRSK